MPIVPPPFGSGGRTITRHPTLWRTQIVMPRIHDEQVLSDWRTLCQHFRRRVAFPPRPKELVPSLFSCTNDQITWHHQNNESWQRATKFLCSKSTPIIESLHELSKENQVHHKIDLVSTTALFAFVSTVMLCAYNLTKDFIAPLLPLANFLDLLEKDTFSWVYLGAGVILFVLLLARARIFLNQAVELSSCIKTTLILRRTAHDPRLPETEPN